VVPNISEEHFQASEGLRRKLANFCDTTIMTSFLKDEFG
jgi:hypothetical protein